MGCDERSLGKQIFLKATCGILCVIIASSASAAFNLSWQTAYDQTSSVTNQLRAVEVSDAPGANSVYVGMIQSSPNREIYKFSTTASLPMPTPTGANKTPVTSDQPKAIATDDRGNVFAGNRISGGNNGEIAVYTSGLNNAPVIVTTNVPTEQFGGLATAHFNGHYYLYASREATQGVSGGSIGGEIRRYIVDNPTSPTLDTGFGNSGVYTIPNTVAGGPVPSNAKTLRGIDVAPDGTIYVTNRDTGLIYRINANLTGQPISAAVPRAMDVTLFSGMAFVTSYNGASSLIRVLSMSDLSFIQDINIATLDGLAYSRGSLQGWGGIDIDASGRIWLGDESYGASDNNAKDRLLVSSPLAAVPEPAAVLVMGVVMLLAPIAVRYTKKVAI